MKDSEGQNIGYVDGTPSLSCRWPCHRNAGHSQGW